ncbi:MAG: phage holin family protein [Vicinamibacteraceae bacterium]
MGELFTELSRDMALLVRKEIELARVEMSRIAATVARRATFIAIGAVLCIAGVLSLVATLTLGGIALGLSPLASSAIVTLLVFAIGGVLVMQGLSALRADSLVPTETIQTLKDTGEIFRARAGEARPAVAAHGRAM